MRRSRKQSQELHKTASVGSDATPADGAFQAMDHTADWVRFADTKATILTAALGVVLTVLMTNAGTVAEVVKKGSCTAVVVGTLAGLTLAFFGYTLFWLVRAIGPRSKVAYDGLNRFAWPTLLNVTTDQLTDHAHEVDVRTDAWQQVIDLSAIANRKFDACGRAVRGFAFLVVLGVATVATAIGFAS